MQAVAGILGPGVSPNDISMEMPVCIRVQSPSEQAELKVFLDTIVRAALKQSGTVLREMLAQTPGADQLHAEFVARLGV
jgi:hypothetical protein